MTYDVLSGSISVNAYLTKRKNNKSNYINNYGK